MKQRNFLSVLAIALLVVGCEIKPRQIAYGSDSCHYCKMSIVDPQHAGQIVTEKGKSFKYDAIECMMNHLREWDQASPKLYLVTTFDQPRSMMDARQAHFLISPSIPSPMGEFLTAFSDPNSLRSYVKDEKDITLDWDNLLEEFSD